MSSFVFNLPFVLTYAQDQVSNRELNLGFLSTAYIVITLSIRKGTALMAFAFTNSANRVTRALTLRISAPNTWHLDMGLVLGMLPYSLDSKMTDLIYTS
jgi:hypothetical protein